MAIVEIFEIYIILKDIKITNQYVIAVITFYLKEIERSITVQWNHKRIIRAFLFHESVCCISELRKFGASPVKTQQLKALRLICILGRCLHRAVSILSLFLRASCGLFVNANEDDDEGEEEPSPTSLTSE